ALPRARPAPRRALPPRRRDARRSRPAARAARRCAAGRARAGSARTSPARTPRRCRPRAWRSVSRRPSSAPFTSPATGTESRAKAHPRRDGGRTHVEWAARRGESGIGGDVLGAPRGADRTWGWVLTDLVQDFVQAPHQVRRLVL